MGAQPAAAETLIVSSAEPLTPAEMTAILAACSPKAATGIRNRALLMLLYRSGLRVSEVLALRPADVDLARHSLRLLWRLPSMRSRRL